MRRQLSPFVESYKFRKLDHGAPWVHSEFTAGVGIDPQPEVMAEDVMMLEAVDNLQMPAEEWADGWMWPDANGWTFEVPDHDQMPMAPVDQLLVQDEMPFDQLPMHVVDANEVPDGEWADGWTWSEWADGWTWSEANGWTFQMPVNHSQLPLHVDANEAPDGWADGWTWSEADGWWKFDPLIRA